MKGKMFMTFDRSSGGHAFDFSAGVCERCGMTREYFQDNGEPRCSGNKSEMRERIPIDDPSSE
jgi:hypothetical protein